MSSSLFNALNGNARQPDLTQGFIQFMQEMKGQNPNQIINSLVSSGRLSQDQLNLAQQRAQQMAGTFESLRGMFGK